MKRCLLHIGMHKTSSTSVQQSLSRNGDNSEWLLLDVGGRANMGSALQVMFLADSSKCIPLTKRGFSPEDIAKKGTVWRAKLKETIVKYTGEVCIISGESLTDANFSENDVKSLREFLMPLFDRITVFGYVRSPSQYKNSRFQERIKHHIEPFLTEEIKYREKFEKFDDVFGASHVILRLFDPSSFPNQCAVADFCQQNSIRPPEDTKTPRLNKSLSRNACSILYAYRSFGQGHDDGKEAILESQHLVRVLQMMVGKKLVFSSSIINAALWSERNDIIWMENRLGVSMKEKCSITEEEIDSGEELLSVSQSAITEFINCFEETYGLCIMRDRHPQGDLIDPIVIAQFLNFCREIIRQILSQNKDSLSAPIISFPRGPEHSPRHNPFGKILIRRIKRIPLIIARNFTKYLALRQERMTEWWRSLSSR